MMWGSTPAYTYRSNLVPCELSRVRRDFSAAYAPSVTLVVRRSGGCVSGMDTADGDRCSAEIDEYAAAEQRAGSPLELYEWFQEYLIVVSIDGLPILGGHCVCGRSDPQPAFVSGMQYYLFELLRMCQYRRARYRVSSQQRETWRTAVTERPLC